jgi:hypothetical protein
MPKASPRLDIINSKPGCVCVHLAPFINFYDSKAYTYIIRRAAHTGADTCAAGTTDGTTDEAYGKPQLLMPC